MTEKPEILDRVLRAVPRTAAILASLIACGVLVGWFADIRWLTSLGAFGPPMAAATAIMLIVASVAIWSTNRARIASRPQAFDIFCALTIAVIAVLALVDRFAHLHIDLDRLLPHIRHAWHPAPQTAVAMLLLAIGIGSGNRRVGGLRVRDIVALGACAIAATAMLGYVFDVPAMYGMAPAEPLVGISFPTTVAILALGFALLVTELETGLLAVLVAPDAGGVVARRLFAGLLAFPPAAALVLLGPRIGWYSYAFAEAAVLLLAFAEASGVIISTATRLGRADAALRESEAHVRRLIEDASDPIFIADPKGHLLDVNRAGCRITRRSREDLVGKEVSTLFASDDVGSTARLLAGESLVSERRLRRSDGRYVPIEINEKLLPDGRWQGIVRDITERKQTELALARAAETQRALGAELQAMMTAVSRTLVELPHSNVDAVLHAIAEQARILTGAEYAAASINADSTKSSERWVDVSPGASAGDSPYRRFQAGHPPVGSMLAVPIKHEGRTIGTIYLGNKLDAREFSEADVRIVAGLADRIGAALETATLYASEGRLRGWLQSLIDQLPDGIVVIDEHAQVKAMNRAVREMAVTNEPDAAPFDIRDLQQNPVPFDELPIMQALRDGSTVRRDLMLRQSDGRMIPVDAAAGPVRDEQGHITGAVVIVKDASERKELERLREEWVAVVAHDLRQPLNTIMLWTDRIAQLSEDETQRSAVARVRSAAWRLNRMIHDLLDAARLTAHQFTIDPRPVDVAALARQVVDTLADGATKIELECRDHELVWVDADRIEQVISNLLSNALKYGTPGRPVRVAIKGSDQDVEIAIANEGEISAADQERLFSRFSRTQKARTARIPGIGLGLFICKGIVEAHHGTIRVESGGGTTTFKFTLPRPPES